MKHAFTTQRTRVLAITLLIALIVSACAPNDLDITPSPTFTPEPTATPLPTATPEGFEAEVNANEAVIEALIELLPNTIPAGAAQWNRDYSRGEDGIASVPGLTNGVGQRMYYSEQTGGQMNISFVVFDSEEDAIANYERIQGIRPVLSTGESDDTFPEPNLFGASNQGSYGIIQIDNYFIEVFIELFSSTGGNPLKPVSRSAVRFFEDNREAFEGGGD